MSREEYAGAVALTGFGTYVPDQTVSGAEIAARSGIPEDVVTEKMGLRRKHVCPPEADHCSDMCVEAGRDALADAGVDPDEVDLVLYHGSEYKDHVVWSAAADIAARLGCSDAFATESYSLCAGAPIAIRQVKAQLLADHVDTALLVTASREEDLVDYDNERSSFMFNFGSGATAMVLESDAEPGQVRAHVHESAAITDGSFSRDVVMPAGGSARPASAETVQHGLHTLDVPDQQGMKERLAEVSLPNFREVAETAMERSSVEDVDFVSLTHMKRSFHELLCEELGCDPGSESYYLDDYGHVQSADQILALSEGLERGLVASGDSVLFLAAGTGYTWAATCLTWQS
ncbi:3-oxoacyl-ACP synthase [Haloarchaeobius sp. HME9146]|uniref:3-oxoacyl-ACP synthase n=1 Tax=Haloarchaeobius sp. HME9146 TaxID=2978732 RepID=UPI0021BF20D8|nr:3-oxoacyl-ACP synthase [Haloarchaeobius sp. HME9146]